MQQLMTLSTKCVSALVLQQQERRNEEEKKKKALANTWSLKANTSRITPLIPFLRGLF